MTKRHIVGVSIDKIQQYLYYNLNSNTQESQSDEGTLQTVIKASNFISKEFSNELEELFKNEEGNKEILLACSGKYIFTTDLSEKVIRDRLNGLFQKYYCHTNGQLLIKFVCSNKVEENKLQMIKQVTEMLKKSSCLNKIIEENQDCLFLFKEVEQKTIDSTNDDYPFFVENINDFPLVGETSNQNHFRIAVIKADLDGMGALFEKIKTYPSYQEVSRILTEYISIEKIHHYTKVVSEEVSQAITEGKSLWSNEDLPPFRMYPLYIAGDDIFFAVQIEHLLNGIEVCKKLLCDLERALSKINTDDKIPKLSLSIGVEITYNREPIRYYYERVDKQMIAVAKNAKVCLVKQEETETECQLNQGEVSVLKVGFNGTVFLDVINEPTDRKKNIQEANPKMKNLFLFTQDVYRMNQALEKINTYRGDSSVGNRFFYTLLQKLTDEDLKKDEKRYQNAILYHLLPRTWELGDSELQEAEFKILMPIIEQFSLKIGKYKAKILDFNLDNLEEYIRLMLLFSDPRFKIIVFKRFEEKKPKLLKAKGATILINRSIEYVYKHLLTLGEDDSLREFFVQRDEYEIEDKKKQGKMQKVFVFRTLNIGTSMFHRMKQIEQKKEQEINGSNEGHNQVNKYNQLILAMIQSTNSQSFEEIKTLEQERKEKKQAPPNLFFDQALLENKIETPAWNEDYIDSLLLFYKLKQLLIIFKTKIK